jgi:5-methylthioadenosine/S-adenosylhomocysteine deaminase
MPGFVDTHRHTWETSIRTSAPDYTLGAYFGAILDKFAPNYRPDDVYAGNLWGALECINAGITTLVDWSHIMNTPAHADAAIRGLRESGIRSVFAFGFPNTSIQDWWFGPDWAGSVERINGDEARRDSQAVPVRRPGPDHDGARHPRHQLLQAGGRALRVGAGQGAGHQHHRPRRDGPLRLHQDAAARKLKELDLLYPNTTYIHSSHLLDDEWQMVADSGGNVSLAPQIELQMGHGWAPAQTARSWASRRAVVRRGDHRLGRPVHPDARHLRLRAGPPPPGRLGRGPRRQHADPGPDHLAQVLRWATLEGAQVAGVADRTGSITPGKKADIVIIDTKAVNVSPVIDPVGAVVCAADISNVKHVLVDGRVLKENFR